MARWHRIDFSSIIHQLCRFKFVLKFLGHFWNSDSSNLFWKDSIFYNILAKSLHTVCVYIGLYGFPVYTYCNLIYIGSQLGVKKGQMKAVTNCKGGVPLKGQNWELTNTHHTDKKVPHFLSLTNSVSTPSTRTSCPSSFPPLLPFFILPHHCPSSSTYLILSADSPQPLVPLFLKEKELKLAGEMNNVPAINTGIEGSVFSCVWRWGVGGGGGGGGCGLYLTFAQTAAEEDAEESGGVTRMEIFCRE